MFAVKWTQVNVKSLLFSWLQQLLLSVGIGPVRPELAIFV